MKRLCLTTDLMLSYLVTESQIETQNNPYGLSIACYFSF